MKRLLRFLFAGFLSFTALHGYAQQALEPGELEVLLAPIALYPDPLLSQILDAARYPQEVAAAAAWSRANPQLSGDTALATVQGTPWPASVKALVAYPDLLARISESPQWLHDLGEAYSAYGPNVMATVQELRERAQASGYLESNGEQYVYDQGGALVVQPAYPNLLYAPYYDPYVVYGEWRWAGYRPFYWRPWVSRPHFVTRVFIAPPVRWYVYPHRDYEHRYSPDRDERYDNHDRDRANREAGVIVRRAVTVLPYHPVPESQRQPFVHSGGTAFIHSAPSAAARLSPPPERVDDHRDPGRRDRGGARRDAPHARPAYPGAARAPRQAPARFRARGEAHREGVPGSHRAR